ncbi:hypothetical protein BCT30_13640 [Enterovibrio norvegicus]|uniref:hypothetical protein n=1 Tax=Enterovibrio norvegicus TaxID=188144 RepID=UPI000C85A338|nr:hypothetical protein [Enterovibrio norvegicus]PMN52169.1 hypothetical protein BCT30_13640 [Enterovibrio norvegicus]
MSILIPIILLIIASSLIANYCYGIYYRRKFILPLVLDFINDKDTDPKVKNIASHAFEDSLDIMLLIKINRALKDNSDRKLSPKSHEMFSSLSNENKNKLFNIIEKSIHLNSKVAFPIYFISRKISNKKDSDRMLTRDFKKGLIAHTHDACF